MVKTGFIAATVFMALSVQPFRRLSVTNKQTVETIKHVL